MSRKSCKICHPVKFPEGIMCGLHCQLEGEIGCNKYPENHCFPAHDRCHVCKKWVCSSHSFMSYWGLEDKNDFDVIHTLCVEHKESKIEKWKGEYGEIPKEEFKILYEEGYSK